MAGVLDRFWGMTLAELTLVSRVHHEQEHHRRRFAAAMTASLMNCWTKHRVSADRLVPPLGGVQEKPQSAEDFHRVMRERKRRQALEATDG